jgi:DNA-directed RNA polymerase specialized sigma24 family protein
MNENDTFERERARLTGLAYRLLGAIADADDVAQEACTSAHGCPNRWWPLLTTPPRSPSPLTR